MADPLLLIQPAVSEYTGRLPAHIRACTWVLPETTYAGRERLSGMVGQGEKKRHRASCPVTWRVDILQVQIGQIRVKFDCIGRGACLYSMIATAFDNVDNVVTAFIVVPFA